MRCDEARGAASSQAPLGVLGGLGGRLTSDWKRRVRRALRDVGERRRGNPAEGGKPRRTKVSTQTGEIDCGANLNRNPYRTGMALYRCSFYRVSIAMADPRHTLREITVPAPGRAGVRRANPSVNGADAAMERYSNGDEAAFAELYDVVAPRLLGFLRKAMRDDSAAEDLMQQTLLQMHRARGSFIPGAAVMPWAFAIARRLIIDSARRRRVERRLFSDAPADDERVTFQPAAAMATADDLLHARRLELRVQRRLESLPETQRTAYRLLQQEGLSLKRAAEVLGTSVTAVKLRAHRAYQALRVVLREAGEAS